VEIEFYDVKSRAKVSVPESAVRKVKYERVAKNGKTVVRHAFRGTHNGTNLTKFVSRDDWEALDAPEE